VVTSETKLNTVTVASNVMLVARAKSLASFLNRMDSFRFTHPLRGEIGVSTGPVELSDRLRIKLHGDPMLLADPVEEPTSKDEMVRDREGVGGADLEFPLSRHHLSVDTTQDDAGIETCCHVLLDKLPTEDLIGSNTTVEGTLLRRVSARGPAEGPAVLEHRILLLDTEQGLVVKGLLNNFTKLAASV
jgi:hypothetical protein